MDNVAQIKQRVGAIELLQHALLAIKEQYGDLPVDGVAHIIKTNLDHKDVVELRRELYD